MNITKIGNTPSINGELIYDQISRIKISNNGNTPTLEIDFADSTRKDNISIPYSQLTIDGDAPESQSAALISLEAVFPKANSSTGGSGGEGGGGESAALQVDITYAALVTAITGSTLVKGQQYKITDFATVHYIIDAGNNQYVEDIVTGVNEPIVVIATSTNTIDNTAKSVLHPEDILHYDWNPINWLDDIGFADLTDTPTIITGFKGVIYFRHDTRRDNYMGYDFRNCKFRRWKTNTPIWDSATTYAKGDFVNNGTSIYQSLHNDNLNNTQSDSSVSWSLLLNFTSNEYWNNRPDGTHGIPSHTDYNDFLTFVDRGGATYNDTVVANHFASFKDRDSFGETSSSILGNNVFFLNSASYHSIYANEIGPEFVHNTICDSFETNAVGPQFINNMIDIGFWGNVLAGYFQRNICGPQFVKNIVGPNFNSNTIGFSSNYNSIGSQVTVNSIGNFLNGNTIGNNFEGNSLPKNTRQNTIENNISSFDFFGGTHISNNYSCTIFKREDGTVRLRYYDNTDTALVENANS